MKCSKTSEDQLSITLHVTILFMVLSVFFVFVISKVERDSINSELDSSIQDAISASFSSLTPIQKKILSPVLKSIPYDKLNNIYGKTADVTATNNKWLIIVIILINVFMVIVVTLLTLSLKSCVNVKQVFIENAITFLFVGIIEYVFFTKIIIKYIPVPPSAIVDTLISELKKKLD